MVHCRYRLDEKAEPYNTEYRVKDGIYYECKNTSQTLPDDGVSVVRRAGDGTVPYVSLRHPASWTHRGVFLCPLLRTLSVCFLFLAAASCLLLQTLSTGWFRVCAAVTAFFASVNVVRCAHLKASA